MQLKKILSPEELKAICLKSLDYARTNEPFYYPALFLLYQTGIRLNELFDIQTQIVLSSNKITFKPSKKNNERTILIENEYMQERIFKCILNHEFLPSQMNSIQRVFSRSICNIKYYHENKLLNTYLYRHNYIKQLYLQHQNVLTVKDLMGHKNIEHTLNYINSEIYYI